ncbi:pentatricopeptide repeat-containing protein At3g02650, mitochondrial-like [Macadamia integrifolia]|uniref:pentatricopeptide repeat-containing protein At3g02650, mitochondrial-like n=1 Tax=Macadamia integrifolia TaxID=60698 RepID=UPI001C4F9620|nr:pentatricopeptide repeat-containing protein At3g02650, mitochondrial-like [Macadamia integrifolia]
MWRLRAGAQLFKCSSRLAPSLQNVVPLKTLTVIRFASPNFSNWISKTKPLYQCPRFFSLDSASNGADSSEEAHDSLDASSSNDRDGVLHEKTGFASQESESSSVLFAEKASFVSHELDASSEIFEDGTDKEVLQGEDQGSSSSETTDGDDQMSSFVSEESVEETTTEIPEIDLEQLENVVSVLQSTLEEPLDSSLEKMDLTVNEEFVIRVLLTPLIVGENLIGFFKWAWKRPEFSISTRDVDTLVRVVSASLRKRDAYALWDLVKEIAEKENAILSTDILNELIHLFRKLGKGKAALEVFNKFAEFGSDPNADSYYFTIDALCCRSFYDWAWSVCEDMLNTGNLPDSEKIDKIICYFCKGSRAKDAHLVYLMAKEKNKHPSRSSVNFLINSLCGEDKTVQLAAELLHDFSGEARRYAIKPFSSVVSGLCRIKEVKAAKDLLFKMIDEGPLPGNAVFNSVINALSKSEEMKEAMELLKVMESRGLRPDVYTYNVIMSGYARGGHMEEACRILSEAKKKHSKLTTVTYHILIRGYCKLEEFDKALKLLSEMKEFGIRPNLDEYNKLIQSLCLRAFDWKTSEKLLEEMKDNGLYLSGITKGLIRATKELVKEDLLAIEVGADV